MRRRVTIGCAAVAAIAALSIAYAPFRESDTEHPCQGAGGAIVWIIDGSRQRLADAHGDIATEQHALDLLAQNPNVADAAHREEYTTDANDAIRADRDTITAIAPCDHVADVRLGLGLAAAVAAAAVVIAMFAICRALARWWTARHPEPTVALQPVDELCPICGALLDDPVGCWSCGAFEDGDTWRLPADAPPERARKLRPR